MNFLTPIFEHEFLIRTDILNGSHILYSNTIRINTSNANIIIFRVRIIKIRFTCAIETELTVSLSNGYTTAIDEIGIDLQPQKSSVNLSMSLFLVELKIACQ